MDKIRVGVIGIGRIGQIHLKNAVDYSKNVEVVAASNRSEEGQMFARELGIQNVYSNAHEILENPEIDAILICSSSDTHEEFSIKALQSGKYVFCEKPLDLDLEKVKRISSIDKQNGSKLMVAFNQRFDPDFFKVIQLYRSGEIGSLRTIKITSRDPEPPPVSYIKTSGGLFLDMTIHDIDMARHIAQSEVREVYAKGQVLIDDKIGEAGDIDTGYLMISFDNDVTTIIENSRQSTYGYDQRLELFGSEGMVLADNKKLDTHLFNNSSGMHSSRPMESFLTRYLDSYRIELNAFFKAVEKGETMPVPSLDGVKATEIAYAANLSMKENRPVRMSEKW